MRYAIGANRLAGWLAGRPVAHLAQWNDNLRGLRARLIAWRLEPAPVTLQSGNFADVGRNSGAPVSRPECLQPPGRRVLSRRFTAHLLNARLGLGCRCHLAAGAAAAADGVMRRPLIELAPTRGPFCAGWLAGAAKERARMFITIIVALFVLFYVCRRQFAAFAGPTGPSKPAASSVEIKSALNYLHRGEQSRRRRRLFKAALGQVGPAESGPLRHWTHGRNGSPESGPTRTRARTRIRFWLWLDKSAVHCFLA